LARKAPFSWAWIAALAVAGAGVPSVQAQVQPQQVTRGETVMERSRPELDPLGVPLGGFLLFPSLSVGESYRDNIFDTESGKQSDGITDIHPALRLQSNWNRHSVALFSDAHVDRYIDHPKEDFEDYTVGGSGRLDVVGRSFVDLTSSYNQLHEDRASPDDVRGIEPTRFTDTKVNLGGTAMLNRVALRLDGRFDRYLYSNVQSASGATINNQDRNRNEGRVTLQAGYELAPLREVFVRGGYDRRAYDNERDDLGFARSSNGYEIGVGANYDLTGVTFAELFVGYRNQSYDDARLKDASGIGASAKLIWNVTRLTTVTGGLERTVEESTLAGASGYFATRATLRVDHELLRNLILHAQGLYGNDDYEGIARTDDHAEAGFGAIYQMSRNFALSGDYAFRARMSNIPGQDFDENLFTLRLTARY
jgi:hypothetical protein